jgi:branched-subunit amino acid transport protein
VNPAVAWAVIIGMAVTNIAFRFVPMALLSRVNLPRPLERWLSFVPVSVMAAIVATQVLTPNGKWVVPWSNPYLLATLPTAAAYWFTRSYLWAVGVGIASFLVFRYLLG